MKARAIEGLDPSAALAVNVRRILVVRVDELRSFMPQVRDPAEQQALHDMRIAAKRLRYVLELTGRAVLGDDAVRPTALVKELQDLLGEIHDCDEMLPRLHAIDGDGVGVLAEHLRLRRGERFSRFLVLWPEVEAAATSCSPARTAGEIGSN